MFAGAEQAVRFAYQMQGREILARPNMTGEARGGNEGLGPHDLHAQGALILQAVERLPEVECIALKAILAPGDEGAAACAALAHLIHPQLQERIPSKAAVLDCIRSWARWKPGVRTIAAEHGVSYRQAMKWRRAVADAHGKLYLRAVQLLEDDLFRPGGLEKK